MKNKSINLTFKGLTAAEILESGLLLDEAAVAFLLSISISKLQYDRHINKTNPEIPFVHVGRLVRYRPDVIKQLILNNSVGRLPVSQV